MARDIQSSVCYITVYTMFLWIGLSTHPNLSTSSVRQPSSPLQEVDLEQLTWQPYNVQTVCVCFHLCSPISTPFHADLINHKISFYFPRRIKVWSNSSHLSEPNLSLASRGIWFVVDGFVEIICINNYQRTPGPFMMFKLNHEHRTISVPPLSIPLSAVPHRD